MKHQIAALMVAAGAALAQPADPCADVAPSVTIPAGTDIFGEPFRAPGPFPCTATAALFEVNPVGGTIDLTQALAGLPIFGIDTVFPAVVGGPLPMTTVFYNTGDNDFNISPADPSDPRSFPDAPQYNDPANPFFDLTRGTIFFDDDDDDSTPEIDTGIPGTLAVNSGPATYAWVPNAAIGLCFATTTDNGRDDGYNFFGSLSPIYSHTQASISRTGGEGYNMIDGTFGNGPGSIFLTSNWIIPISLEALTDHAVVWLPFSQGWTGGWVNSNDEDAQFTVIRGIRAASPDLPETSKFWTDFQKSLGRIEIPGATPDSGMIFVESVENQNIVADPDTFVTGVFGNEVGVLPDDTGWDFAVRQVSGLNIVFDDLGNVGPSDGTTDGPPPVPFPGDDFGDIDNGFQFFYLPYDTCNLIGGEIEADGSATRLVGDATVTRVDTGLYAVEIPGAQGEIPNPNASNEFTETIGGDITNATGVLLLQAKGSLASATLQELVPGAPLVVNPGVPTRALTSYDFDPSFGDAGAFIVSTHELVADGSDIPAGTIVNVDSGFYFAYFDFANPWSPAGNLADLNGDGVNTLDDILVFTAAFNVASPSPIADLNGDGLNTLDDILVFTGIFDANAPACAPPVAAN